MREKREKKDEQDEDNAVSVGVTHTRLLAIGSAGPTVLDSDPRTPNRPRYSSDIKASGSTARMTWSTGPMALSSLLTRRLDCRNSPTTHAKNSRTAVSSACSRVH
jgi:hypothetical protein